MTVPNVSVRGREVIWQICKRFLHRCSTPDASAAVLEAERMPRSMVCVTEGSVNMVSLLNENFKERDADGWHHRLGCDNQS